MPPVGRRRTLRTALLASVAASAAALASASHAGAMSDVDWCSTPKAPPCVLTATRNGTAVGPANTSWDVHVAGSTVEGSTNASWFVQSVGTADPYELGAAALDDRWTVTLDTGSLVPRVVTGYGGAETVSRDPQPGGTYHVTLAANPVTVTDNAECDVSKPAWTCPATAGSERKAYLAGEVTDYGAWEDVAQRASMLGMNFTTNVAVTTVPPQVVVRSDTAKSELIIQLANQHAHPDGSVFQGFASLRIPNAFLKEVYGVDDPTTLTTDGLASSIGSGTVSVTPDSGGGAMRVDVTGITFSRRVLHVRRGTITPTKPTEVSAKRTSKHGGSVSFHRAKARGSRITGYRVRCVKKSGGGEMIVTSQASPVAVTGLKTGAAYVCRVRARSKAGVGSRSKEVPLAGTVKP